MKNAASIFTNCLSCFSHLYKLPRNVPGKADVGVELLFLLRQQRYLYHQLKILTDRQQQSAGTDSPELLLGFISGRRKLVEKLRELEDKLRAIKANWQKLFGRIGPEYKVQAGKIANQVQEIIGEILAAAPSEMAQKLPLSEDCRLDRLFAGT